MIPHMNIKTFQTNFKIFENKSDGAVAVVTFIKSKYFFFFKIQKKLWNTDGHVDVMEIAKGDIFALITQDDSNAQGSTGLVVFLHFSFVFLFKYFLCQLAVNLNFSFPFSAPTDNYMTLMPSFCFQF